MRPNRSIVSTRIAPNIDCAGLDVMDHFGELGTLASVLSADGIILINGDNPPGQAATLNNALDSFALLRGLFGFCLSELMRQGSRAPHLWVFRNQIVLRNMALLLLLPISSANIFAITRASNEPTVGGGRCEPDQAAELTVLPASVRCRYLPICNEFRSSVQPFRRDLLDTVLCASLVTTFFSFEESDFPVNRATYPVDD